MMELVRSNLDKEEWQNNNGVYYSNEYQMRVRGLLDSRSLIISPVNTSNDTKNQNMFNFSASANIGHCPQN